MRILGRKRGTIGTLLLICGTFSLLFAAETKFDSREAEIADAVKKNGPIFVNWPKPDLVLVFSGEMDGYLEPCGCAGLENQKGGLKRRHTVLNKLVADGWPVVALDMGGQIRRFGPQADIKYRFAMKALTALNYQAIGLGIKELQLDSNYLAYVLSNFEGRPNPVISANLSIIDPSLGLSSRYRAIQVGSIKIGVTAVLGREHQAALQNFPDIHWTDPIEALQKVLPEMQAENCDLLILLAHANPDEAKALAKQFPQFQFVATTGGAEEPPHRLTPLEGTPNNVTPTQYIEAGHKGMYLTVVGLYDDPQQPIRLQRVPLDHRFENSAAMQTLLVEYQNELKTMELSGLGLSGSKHPVDSFVGSEACADCHTEATKVFEATPHAHATQSLVGLEPPRHYDPECLSCHVTGWNPQEFFPYASGYKGLTKTPHLTDNGCENCHGPGAAHVAAESGDTAVDDAELERLRTGLRLKIVENEGNKDGQEIKTAVVVKMCLDCHDLDNSPEFDFQKYWPKVEHHGKD